MWTHELSAAGGRYCATVLVGWLVSAGCLAGCGESTQPASLPSSEPSGALLRSLSLTTDVPAAVVAGCRREAHSPARVIYCPPIVPSGGTAAIVAGVFNIMALPGRWTAIADFASASMTTLHHRAVNSNGGHWVIASGTDPWLHIELFTAVPAVRRSLRRTSIDGQAVSVYRIPQHLASHFAGHVVATWTRDGIGYYASVHGYPNRSRTLAIAQGLIALQHRCGARHAPTSPCNMVMTAPSRNGSPPLR